MSVLENNNSRPNAPFDAISPNPTTLLTANGLKNLFKNLHNKIKGAKKIGRDWERVYIK